VVIMAAVTPARSDVLRAVSLGAAGFLLRPYSQIAFSRHLAMARHMASYNEAGRAALARARQAEASGDPNQAVAAFAAVADGPDAAPRLFEAGMTALAAKDLEGAIAQFHKAIEYNALFVEAYLGLARAWHAKGSLRQYRHFMKQAASTCARAHRFEELRDRFVELLARDEAGFNPFLALGNELLSDRRYTAAVALFRHAQSLAPKNADAALGLAKAHHFLRQPDLARRALDKALDINDRSPEALAMFERLTGRRHGDISPREEAPVTPVAVQYPWLLRGVLYLAGWATNGLMRSRRTAQAA
jgi:tetratricopeptide (TPR) repeat protein